LFFLKAFEPQQQPSADTAMFINTVTADSFQSNLLVVVHVHGLTDTNTVTGAFTLIPALFLFVLRATNIADACS
jgi:hypothetical protein